MHALDRNPVKRGISVALKTFLLLLVSASLAAWDLPFMSQRTRGDNRYAEGSYAEAIEHYTRASETDAGNWEIHYNLGTSYYREGYWDSAVTELQLAADLAEGTGASSYDISHCWHNLGLAYLQLDDCENAVPALMRALELDESDEDLKRNAEFSMEYCEEETEDAEQNEGESEDEGEGDEDQEEEGQNDEGESNDESEVQDDSERDEDGEQGEGEKETDEGESEGDEGEDQEDQSESSGEDEGEEESDRSDDEQGEGGDEITDDRGREKETGDESEGEEDEKRNADESENGDENRDGGNLSQGRPNEIPDDGLNLSDEQIEQLLRQMSNLERSRAPRYFNNTPNDGDFLDDESFTDLLRRLFLGLPPEKYEDMPEDGIDW